MTQSLRDDLSEILQADHDALHALLAKLKDESNPHWKELSTGLSSYKTVRKNLDRSVDSDFHKQGLRYLKRAAKGVDDPTLARTIKSLTAWDKAWKSRPLPNESAAMQFLQTEVPLLANKTYAPKCLLLDQEGIQDIEDQGQGWDVLNSARDGVYIRSRGKTHIDLCFAKSELADRLYKYLNSRLGKAIAKPTGTAKSKVFVGGNVKMATERGYSRCNGYVPFDMAIVTVSLQKGSAEISL